jgi:hypothetical protein
MPMRGAGLWAGLQPASRVRANRSGTGTCGGALAIEVPSIYPLSSAPQKRSTVSSYYITNIKERS